MHLCLGLFTAGKWLLWNNISFGVFDWILILPFIKSPIWDSNDSERGESSHNEYTDICLHSHILQQFERLSCLMMKMSISAYAMCPKCKKICVLGAASFELRYKVTASKESKERLRRKRVKNSSSFSVSRQASCDNSVCVCVCVCVCVHVCPGLSIR